jgi:hypothetical protein
MSPSFRRRIRRSRRQLLAEHADRAGRWMVAIVLDAKSMGAAVPEELDDCLVVLRTWSIYLTRWAEEQ